MPGLRYTNDMNVQGWEPLANDERVNNEGFLLPSGFGVSSPTSTGVATNNNTSSLSGRQAPPARARAATCPDIYDFSFMPRSNTMSSTPQQQSSNSSPTVPVYGCSTQRQSQSQPKSGVPSSARNAAASGRSGSRPRSSTERKIARKLAENANYVPRPKNSFILFRTEFVAQRTSGAGAMNQRTKSDTSAAAADNDNNNEDDETNQSLSKQASEVWNRMSDADKKPWVERAKLEKAAHEAKYPHYRYKPVRHTSARKNLLPPSCSSSSTTKAGQSQSVSAHDRSSLGLQRRSSEPATTTMLQVVDAKEDGDSLPESAVEQDNQWSAEYQPHVASNSGMTLETTDLHMPVPSRKLSLPTALPSSSSLAGALGPRSPIPAVQEDTTKPTLPTVPPVPALNLAEARPSRTSGLPPIPRSPSAPIFNRNVIGQFPYHQQQQRSQFMPSSSSFSSRSQAQSSYLSIPGPSPAFANTDATISPSTLTIASGSGLGSLLSNERRGMTLASPRSSVSGSDLTSPEPDYFRDFIQCDAAADLVSAVSESTPSSSLPSQNHHRLYMNDNEKFHDDISTSTLALDNKQYDMEMDEMDIDMRTLLNLSPLPEVAEPPLSASAPGSTPISAPVPTGPTLGGTTNGTDACAEIQRPFEAIAALWIQDQQRTTMTTTTNDNCIATTMTTDSASLNHQSQAQMQQMQMQTQTSPKTTDPRLGTVFPPPTTTITTTTTTPKDATSFSTERERDAEQETTGLDTYTLAVSGEYFTNCTSTSTSTSANDNLNNLNTSSCLEDDLLRLDLDLDLDHDFRPVTMMTGSGGPTSRFGIGGCLLSPGMDHGLSSFEGNSSISAATATGTGVEAGVEVGGGDVFGYDRERGLYGYGYGFGFGTGLGNAFDYGF